MGKMPVSMNLLQLIMLSPEIRRGLRSLLRGRKDPPQAGVLEKVTGALRCAPENQVLHRNREAWNSIRIDQDCPRIEVTIMGQLIPDVLIDAGSAVNVMSYELFEKLALRINNVSNPLRLADNSVVRPEGVVSQLPVEVAGRRTLCDFKKHVIRLLSSRSQYPCLLGRPWMRRADCILDIPKGGWYSAGDGRGSYWMPTRHCQSLSVPLSIRQTGRGVVTRRYAGGFRRDTGVDCIL